MLFRDDPCQTGARNKGNPLLPPPDALPALPGRDVWCAELESLALEAVVAPATVSAVFVRLIDSAEVPTALLGTGSSSLAVIGNQLPH